MVFAHTQYFIYSGSSVFLLALTRTSNMIAFPLLLFASSASSYAAYVSPPEKHRRIITRIVKLLLSYWLIAYIVQVLDTQTLLSFNAIIETLLFVKIPSFTEFLLPFIIYSFSLFLFHRIIQRLTNNMTATIGVSLIMYSLGMILYSMNFSSLIQTWISIFTGGIRQLRFPVFQYAPFFLAGFIWGKRYINNQIKRTSRISISIVILCLMTVSLFIHIYGITDIPMFDPAARWPPSISYTLLTFLVIYLITIISLQLERVFAVCKWFIVLVSSNIFSIYVFQIISLYIYRWLQLPRVSTFPEIVVVHSISLLFVITLSIVLTILTSKNKGEIAFHISHHQRISYELVVISTLSLLFVLQGLNIQTSSSPVGNFIFTQTSNQITKLNIHKTIVQSLTLSCDRQWYITAGISIPDNPSSITCRIIVSPKIPDANIYLSGFPEGIKSKATYQKQSESYIITIPVASLSPNSYTLHAYAVQDEIAESNTITLYVSAPVFVSWTLDWEGLPLPQNALSDIQHMSESHDNLPITHFFNPRIFLPSAVSTSESDFIVNWIKDRTTHQDETALHMHMFYDMVNAAGVTPKTRPQWGYQSDDGYDVLTTVYSSDEFTKILTWAKNQFSSHDFPEPKGYRAGGWFVDEKILKSLIDSGFHYDSSGRDKEMWNNKAKSPWNLTPITQPYYPSLSNQNETGNPAFTILEIPNNGGNTYEYTKEQLLKRFTDNYSGGWSKDKKSVVFLSHPQWADREFPKIHEVFDYIDKFLLSKDQGPVVYVTISTIYSLWKH